VVVVVVVGMGLGKERGRLSFEIDFLFVTLSPSF
jgi:hypothetical protein